MSEKEWFATWFDSPYYHLLYQHRDDREAQVFLSRLLQEMQLTSSARILDLACGKGRHSITLAQKGFEVLGADLAANSIAEAEKNRLALQLTNLRFVVHDMREPLQGQIFSAVFNLFTSFGYFDTLQENQAVCKSIADALAPAGLLVIDFLNAHKVIAQLRANETIEREGVTFQIERWHTKSHIFKKIDITDLDKHAAVGVFTERVQALTLSQFEELLAPYFDIQATYGSYDLAPFSEQGSERLIIIAKKKS
ncbi:MAG: class I SAM-dependent methyltransferase [Flavobacteriales bacterium]